MSDVRDQPPSSGDRGTTACQGGPISDVSQEETSGRPDSSALKLVDEREAGVVFCQATAVMGTKLRSDGYLSVEANAP